MTFKNALFLAIPLFIAGVFLGAISSPDMLDDLVSLQGLSDRLASSTQLALFFLILINNAVTFLFTFVLSPFLCIAPVVGLLVNGWVIGLVSVIVIQQESLGFVLAGILPHGIIEIPALLIAEASAIGFGSSLMMYMRERSARENLIPRLWQNGRLFGIAMLMLPAAAVIEVFITPLILNLV